MGRVIDKDGLSMSKEKIETVLNFPLPKEVTSLRGFLGLANYFRQFVPFHSDIVKLLQMTVDPKALNRSPIYWTPEGTLAFNETKIAVSHCTSSMMIHPSDYILMHPTTVSVVYPSKLSTPCGDQLSLSANLYR